MALNKGPVFLWALSLVASAFAGDPCGVLPASHVDVPCVRVHPCSSGLEMARIHNYSLDDGSGPAVQQTEARLCYDAEYLTIFYRAKDDNVYSNFSKCNDTVWVDDALEFMVAEGTGDPVNYTEIDISPAGGLWTGAIYNPTGHAPSCPTKKPCTELGCHRGVEHREEVTPEGWEAVLRVPWELIRSHGGQHPRHEGRVWRANFYRTDMRKGTTQQEYSAWSTTYQSPAAFHVPKYFGVMLLD